MITAIRRAPARAVMGAGLALAAALGSFAATTAPAQAATPRGAYVVALVTPLAAPRAEILDGIMWRCTGEACRGGADGGRPVAACARVARKFGPVARFATPEGELQPEELARCNGAK